MLRGLRGAGEEAWPGWAAVTPAEWAALVRLAQRLGVASLLYRRLQDAGRLAVVPTDQRQALREFYLVTAARSLQLGWELGIVLEALGEARLRVIPLKGAVLGEQFYGDPGLRIVGDLDLLVPEQDVGVALQVLAGLGYVPDARFESAFAVPLTKHTTLRPGPKATAPVEVHWGLLTPDQTGGLEGGELWERAVRTTVAGVGAWAMAPEDLLLHLALHVAHEHVFAFGLRPFCDLTAVVSGCEHTLDWEALVTRAQRWQLERGTYLALRLAREWLGAPVPHAVLEQLRDVRFEDRILKLVRDSVFTEPPPGCPRLSPGFAAMCREPRLIGRLQALRRRIFADPRLLAARYGVPPESPWIRLYYLRRLRDHLRRYLPLAGRLRRDRDLQAHLYTYEALSRWLSGG